MPLLSGVRLGRYEIRSLLGTGGMGEVYLAEDMQLHRKVALKLLPAEFTTKEDRLHRFEREAHAASSLNHPNILTIHEIGTEDGHHFITTEFIEGESLRQHINRALLELHEVLEIGIQVASALAAAHAARIVHRDIKPENIMLRTDGFVKVLDFGLAKLVEQEQKPVLDTEAPTTPFTNTAPGIVMGTVTYMSPEQARGRDVDARTDIWSLGVVLYEMVAGRLPFAGETTTDVLGLILHKEPPPLTHSGTHIPVELDRIVTKALKKDKEERYQVVKDLGLDLKSLKQRLEFEAELERTETSERNSKARRAATSGDDPVAGTMPVAAARTGASSDTHTTASSAEYIAHEIKQHKRGAALVLATLLLAIAGLAYFYIVRSSNASINSVAVLPFVNESHDADIEYLSDGITESLINSLSQVPRLKVIARSSVFRYKGKATDPQQIATELGVQAMMTGRVTQRGDMLSVSVELMDTQNNTQLWGQRYTRKASDIFAVQDEIARQVTDTLRVRLTGVQQEQVTKRYTENAEAYRLYLQGRYYLNQISEEGFNRAIPFFDQAIALDPRYALAYAARGESFFNMGDLGLPNSEAMPKAKRDIATALSMDDKLVEARTTLAAIKFQFDWDFAGAEEEFKQIIASNPNYAEAHHQYGWYLALTGRPMEGVAEMKLAQQLDPVNIAINIDVNAPYYLARQFDQSIAQSRKALEMFPNSFAHYTLGWALVQKGDYSTGIGELQRARAIEAMPLTISTLGWSYAKSGRKDEARKSLVALKQLSKRRHVTPYWIAMIYVGLDEKDEAFVWLEKAFQERSFWLMWIKMDPMVDSLRSDARFTDLMRRIGFPQ